MNWFSQKTQTIEGRRKVSLVISGIVTGVIAASWFMIWREYQLPVAVKPETTTASPVTAMKTVFVDGYSRFIEEFGIDPLADMEVGLTVLSSSTASTTETLEFATTTGSTTEVDAKTATTTDIEY